MPNTVLTRRLDGRGGKHLIEGDRVRRIASARDRDALRSPGLYRVIMDDD